MITKEQYNEAVKVITQYENELFEEYSKTVKYRNEHLPNLLKTEIEDLDLSVKAFNCLKASKINSLSQLVKLNRNDILNFRNFGKRSLVEVEAMLHSKGLSFGMNLNGMKNMVNDTP
jgi:DNA-directed RNA polymerase alpha subunit